jgi:hypothetical protein
MLHLGTFRGENAEEMAHIVACVAREQQEMYEYMDHDDFASFCLGIACGEIRVRHG